MYRPVLRSKLVWWPLRFRCLSSHCCFFSVSFPLFEVLLTFPTPNAGDDPFWEAVDLWYGVTADLEWYDPQQVTTRDGALIITMDSADTQQSGITPNSTAPFTLDENHGLKYRSGMLQSWNKFCFTTGYIEVAVILPGPNQETTGYVSDRNLFFLFYLFRFVPSYVFTSCSACRGRHLGDAPCRATWL